MAVLRSPIKIIGGKGVLRKKLLPYFPPHRVYVEPFGGGASVLLAKPRSDVEVYNDLDPRIVNLFRVITNERDLDILTEQLMLTLYSREERLHSMSGWKEEEDPVARARMFFVDCRQSLGGMIDRTSWGLVTKSSVNGMAQPIHAYIGAIKMLPRIAARMKMVQLHNVDYKEILFEHDGDDTLFYLDPPYPRSTRRDGWYSFEMSEEDHEEMIGLLTTLRGMVVLSAYPNELYSTLEKHQWKCVSFSRSCNAAARTKHTQLQGEGVVRVAQGRTECLWTNRQAQNA
jgi:DNA adenine methylase